MDPTQPQPHAMRSLIESQQVAALATLHKGKPAASMVPYALLPHGRGFVIFVSSLATHTADMLEQPAVSLLITAPAGSTATPQETPRASVQGRARRCACGADGYEEARARYLARFPHSEEWFGFADFSLFIIEVDSVRFVGGFAKASSFNPESFASLMGSGG